MAGNSEDAQREVGSGEGERGRGLPTDFRWIPSGLPTGIARAPSVGADSDLGLRQGGIATGGEWNCQVDFRRGLSRLGAGSTRRMRGI